MSKSNSTAARNDISEANPVPVLLPLDAPRSVAFKTKKAAFIYHFRRISLEDWQKFFTGIVHQTLQSKAAREEVFETESSLLELVENTLTSVSGYGDLSKLKNWRQCLPIQHRVAAGVALRSVGESKAAANAELPILCDLVEVSLDANWGADSTCKTTLYSGLIHRFRQPGIAELKRFNFESARVRVTGTADAGITTYPARQAIAMKIYDDLIESVDGYSVGGAPLTCVDAIKREMDGAHKAAAALALFNQDDEITIG
jgi:hypothetical protein